MSEMLLNTKLFVPPLRPFLVPRPRLIETLNQGLAGKLTLISAPAGFGKTTLISSWIDALQTESDPPHARIAWLSLDENDSAPARFLSYVIAALQSVDAHIGQTALPMLQASPLPIPTVLTMLLNDIAAQPDPLLLVLDDYHVVDARPIDEALAFLLDHMPPQLHVVITTREDPNLPLARLRVRGLLTELRAADLRFSVSETAVFLQQVMGLVLTEAQIGALEERTEGWIAGLQMAGLSMRGQADVGGFIDSFTGSHRFVLDYLLEEVLHQQPDDVQAFLLKTAVLNQMTAPLCDALTGETNSQEILESLDRANLFLVPLDNERLWYRYHHLFGELLRQTAASSEQIDQRDLHIRASQWYEANGLELEAFQHAAAAGDVARATRLIEGGGVPLYFRREVEPVRLWLASLPEAEFEANPSLRVTYASVLVLNARMESDIEGILQAAETALASDDADDRTADLLGQIAANRAMLAVLRNQTGTLLTQSQRALALLHPDNLPMRATAVWTMGYGHQVAGNRAAALDAYAETIAHCRQSGNLMLEIGATTSVGQIQETQNQAHQAADTFQRVLELVGDPPWGAACEACVGLGRVYYQWNDLEAAERYGQRGLELAQQLGDVDTPASCGVLLAKVRLARGEITAALTALDEADAFVQQHNFEHRPGEIAAVRIRALLRQGDLAAAARLAEQHDLPLSRARIQLAQDEPAAALATLEPVRRQAEAKAWVDEQLRVMLLQALAYESQGETAAALAALDRALTLAEPERHARLFIDEGTPMARLLRMAAAENSHAAYATTLLAGFGPEETAQEAVDQSLIDPLSERELEVLALIVAGLKNREIADELVISLNTVLYHTKNIYGKLGVNKRALAIARAAELNLIP